MGPFTLFRMTWGLPKPVMGMSLSSCPERLSSLSFSHISPQPPRPVCSSVLIAALILRQICGEFNDWKTQANDGFAAEKRGKERRLACRRLQGAINVNWKWVKLPAVRTQKSLIPQNNKSTPITPCGPGAVVPCGFCGEKRHQWLYTSRKVNPPNPEGKGSLHL